ncbi:hypothetical protein RX327_19750 [Bradyrhizobium sp. BEA-2-5]|uniref:hypothetical protein n=1 Tax=Bradyrhizobium sp. BEA-2-5 TaxID=3080015 RepID=UPI00293F0076|nr:hypothetical protein [Bradyrhizobium sp. BEA-2-5]WOH78208.1 hypothetical protein RX327_19750 [Bradyrhizobium sp. BEA-2-5]
MATFHLQGHRRLYIHNTLDQGAFNAKSAIEKKLLEGNRDGIGFDYMSCGLMLAFTFEAQVNFFGNRILKPWNHYQRWKGKVERVFEVLSIEFDWSKRPFVSLWKMKTFRDTIAHGKAFEQDLNEDVEGASIDEVRKAFNLKQAWESMMTHDEIMQAYDDTNEIWKLMIEKSGIEITETIDQVDIVFTPKG